jgi:hypothetical protein
MGLLTPTAKSKSAVSTPPASTSAVAPAAAVGMLAHQPYARALAKLDQIRAELTEAEASAAALYADLCRQPAQLIDPVRAEAMRLLGDGDGGDSAVASNADKTDQLSKLRSRIAVLRIAEQEGDKLVRQHDRKAAHTVMAAATPEYHRRLKAHASAVVAAARSLADVQELLTAVGEEVGSSSCSGFSNHAFLLFGDVRDPYSSVGLFIKGLVEEGVLSGNEDFLTGLAFVARRPDGSTVDHTPPAPPPVPPRERRAAPSVPAPPRPKPKTLPTTPDWSEWGSSATATATAPRYEGPTKSVRALKDMACEKFFPAGQVRDFPEEEACQLVACGHAEWAEPDAAAADLAKHREAKAALKGGTVATATPAVTARKS